MSTGPEIVTLRRLLLAECAQRKLNQDTPDAELAAMLAETLNSVNVNMPQRPGARGAPKECRPATVEQLRAFLYRDGEPVAVTMRAVAYFESRHYKESQDAAPAAVAEPEQASVAPAESERKADVFTGADQTVSWLTSSSGMTWSSHAPAAAAASVPEERPRSPAASVCESASESGGAAGRIPAHSKNLGAMFRVCGITSDESWACDIGVARDGDLCVMEALESDNGEPNGYVWTGPAAGAATLIDGPFALRCAFVLGMRPGAAAVALERARRVISTDPRFMCRGQWMRAYERAKDLRFLHLILCVCAIEANARAGPATPRQ